MAYTVRALRNSGVHAPGSQVYFQSHFDEWIPLSCYVWLIQGDGLTAVVDTGVRDIEVMRELVAWVGPQRNWRMAPGCDTLSLLANAGVGPDDVDLVILTHLHYDHCSNVRLFPRAQVVVSRRGWLNVMAPCHALPSPLFPRDVFAYLADEAWDRLLLVGEEEELRPGLRVFWVGGHTPCSQAVLIETARGKVILAGDTLFVWDNLELGIPIGVTENLQESYDAMARFKREGDLVIPGHDSALFERFPDGFIA